MKRIAPVLLGCDALVQAKLDAKVSEFDGTPNKRKLGRSSPKISRSHLRASENSNAFR
jgi:enolase